MGEDQIIPEEELQITFARSSGAGGQNVNKVESKVIIHWNVGNSAVFTDGEKERIREKLSNKLNSEDEIVVMTEEERSQAQNRDRAIEKLETMVRQAMLVPKKRKQTKPTKSSQEKRLESKKKHSRLKESRRNIEI